MTDLVYLYAIVSHPLQTSVRGIDGRLVRWVEANGLAAAVSDVPAEEFEEEPLNTNVRDLGWLGPRAVAHQEVNAQLHESAEAMVPLAFGSVFRDDDRVRQMLADQSQALAERLQSVRGASEWVVALHQLAEPAAEDVSRASPAVQELETRIEASAPGRAHLLRRQLATLQHDEASRLSAEAADGVLAQLRAVASDAFVEPLPSDAVERPLLRVSLLVRHADETRFLERIDELRQKWPEPTYRLQLTGPWPAYRFAGLKRDHG